MIDWFNLGANAVWVVGCSVVLAALSYASWEASLYQQKFSERLKPRGMQLAINLGGLLICLGAALTRGEWWWMALWGLIGAICLVQVVRILRMG
jgi:hypothetical protein